ncbi:hypothetical protein Scep_004171 [Stephania cephalantha]|uniref:Uncharacterized protein n=1 Tax=Stephania cephalantha TaxID=152367 RepID=A0AAP0PV41_9MAGN
MAINGGLNSKIHLKDANLAMIYAFHLLREQSVASSSFVEVTPYCPLLLCLVGDRSVRQCATAPLLHAVHRAAAVADLSLILAGVTAPRQRPGGPCRRSSSSPTAAPPLSPPLLLAVCPPAGGATEARQTLASGATLCRRCRRTTAPSCCRSSASSPVRRSLGSLAIASHRAAVRTPVTTSRYP